MSIIYDKYFLRSIYKLAQDISPKISKEIVEKLFSNLKEGGGNQISSLGGSSGFNAVTISNIANLQNYLSFLRDKGVTFSGEKIISSELNMDDDGSFKDYKLNLKSIQINSAGLKNHVLLLFNSPDYKSNPLYREMLGRLVAQIKSELGIDISLPDMGDETEIIRLMPNVDLDRYSPGDRILRLKHLKTGAFDSWYKDNIESVNKGGKKLSEQDGICPLLEFISKNMNNPEKYKQNVIQCAREHNCPWAGQGNLPSSPASPGSTSPTAPSSQGNLSDAGRMAENNLKNIINGGGPFYREYINIGMSANEVDSNSLLAFINNAQVYFSDRARFHQETADSGILSTISSIKARLLECDRLLGNMHYYTPTSKIPSLEYQIGFQAQDESMRQYRSSNLKACLDELLNQVVRTTISHIDPGGYSSKFAAQTSNQLNNKEQVINNIYFYNKPKYR